MVKMERIMETNTTAEIYEETHESLERILKKSNRANLKIAEGDDFIVKGRYNLGLGCYMTAILINPRSSDAYDSMIDTLNDMKNLPGFQNENAQKGINAKIEWITQIGIINEVYDVLALKLHNPETPLNYQINN